MAIEKRLDNELFWEDPLGRLNRKSNIDDVDVLRDEAISMIAEEWLGLQRDMKSLKDWVYGIVSGYLDELYTKYDVKRKKDNSSISLTDYSGQYRLKIQVAKVLCANEKAKLAQDLIKECADEWSPGAKPELMVIVDDAFARNADGNMSVARLLGLKRLAINGVKWDRAMEIISEAVTVETTKRYIRLYKRDKSSDEEKWVAIPLDLASL